MALYKNPKKDLRLHYKKVFEISLIVSLIFVIVAFSYFPNKTGTEIIRDEVQGVINIEDAIRTIHATPPPPPPKPLVPIEIPEDMESLDIEINSELEANKEISTPPIFHNKKDEITDEEPTIFVVVEELPEPIGGMDAIYSNLEYPKFAIRSGIHGTVHLTAFIDKNGDVFKVEVLKGIGAGCDEAAAEAIKAVKFKPGRQRGKPVNVAMGISIRFVIIN